MLNHRFVVVVCGYLLAVPAFAQSEPPPLEGGAPATASEAAPAAEPAVAPPLLEPATPAPEPAMPPPPAAQDPRAADADAVFRAFRVYAAAERDRRLVGAVAGVATGLVTIGLGAALAEPTNTDPTVWYVLGGVSAGLSALSFFLPSPAESMARSFRVKEAGHSIEEARALEIQWNDLASSFKRRRVTGGAISLVLSAFVVGSGVAILSGAGDFTDSDRYFLGSLLIGSGAAVGVSGVANLFVKSSAERSFEAYRAVRPEPVAIAPALVLGPGGWLAGAAGTF